MGRCLGLFVMSALQDAIYLAWVHYAEQHRPWPAAVVAMALVVFGIIGYEGALDKSPGRWARLTAIVLGYGVGTFCAITFRDLV